jgi:hypothetical protein
VLLVVVSLSLLIAGPAVADSLRADRSVAGVRATLRLYDNALLSGNAKTGCALFTKRAQAQLARTNHVASCADVIRQAAALLKANSKEAAAVRAYASKAYITLSGSIATVTKLDGSGTNTLTYMRGLWYVS